MSFESSLQLRAKTHLWVCPLFARNRSLAPRPPVIRVSQTLEHWGALMRLGLIASLLCLCTVSLCLADPAKAAIRKDLNVPPESLSPALQQVATAYELQVLYPTQVAKDLKTHGAVGFFTPDDALKAVLSGTGLSYKYLDANTVTVFSTAAPAGVTAGAGQDQTNTTQDNSKEAGKKSSHDFLVAQATSGQTPGPSTVEKQDEQASKKKPVQLEEVVVTGSRLPTKTKEGAQPVMVYTKEQIERSGQTSVAEFLNTLPDVGGVISENGVQTFLGTTTIQLHGLPVGSTLVLINGRRAEASGSSLQGGQATLDLNVIPLAAIQRIEVLPVGSSAVYGSDAIAGVVNIVLRENVQGFEGDVKYGFASGTNDTTANGTWGRTWDRGFIAIFGTFEDRSELTGAERTLTANNDYTPYGGLDERSFDCNPANVFSLDGTNLPGLNAPVASVPKGFNGTPSLGEFANTAGVLSKCSLGAYHSIIPASRRETGFLNGKLEVTDSTEIFAEFMVSHVEQQFHNAPPELTGFPQFNFAEFTVPANNPFNPFGTTVGISDLVTNLGPTEDNLTTTFLRPLIGARGRLSATWNWEIATWLSADHSGEVTTVLNSGTAQSALNSPNPASALNPFVTGQQASPSVLQSMLETDLATYTGQTRAVSGFIRGEVAKLSSADLNAVIGSEYFDTLYSAETAFSPEVQPSLKSYAFFGELKLGILPNTNNPALGDALTVTGALRYDHYGTFGGKTTPNIGVEWRPVSEFLLRGTYGQAYKAPNLIQLYQPLVQFPFSVTDPRNGQVESVTVNLSGNPNLQPETGSSYAIGFVYAPAESPLELSATNWSIREDGSIQDLTIQGLVNNEALFPFAVVRNSAGIITAVNYIPINFGKTEVNGIDFTAKYTLTTSAGTFSPSLTATNTYHYTSALQPGAPETERAGIANDDGNWAPKWKGTAAVSWEMEPLAFTLAGRYVGKYMDYDSTNVLGNFWLLDANLRLTLGHLLDQGNRLKGTYLEIGGVNLANTLPQFSNYPNGMLGYDPYQGDIRGRFLYAKIGVKW